MARTFAYISNAESKDISIFEMDRKLGVLSTIDTVPVPGTDLPSPTSLPIAVSPDRRFLYAGLRSPPFAASTFSIDLSTGLLRHQSLTPLIHAMAYFKVSCNGRFLLCASYTDAKIAVYEIDSNGSIKTSHSSSSNWASCTLHYNG